MEGKPTDPALLALIERARRAWDALTPEEQDRRAREQARRYALAEAAWDEDSTVVVTTPPTPRARPETGEGG